MKDAEDILWDIYEGQPNGLKSKSLDMANYAKILMTRLVPWYWANGGRNRDIESRIAYIHKAMLYYDIGMMLVPSHITQTSEPNCGERWEQLRGHTHTGVEYFNRRIQQSGVDFQTWRDFIEIALDTMLCHHERWDGRGYPSGLSGRNIPVCARFCAIADCYEELTSKRAYGPARGHKEAFASIIMESGKAFDPFLIKVFIRCDDEFSRYLEQSRQGPQPVSSFYRRTDNEKNPELQSLRQGKEREQMENNCV